MSPAIRSVFVCLTVPEGKSREAAVFEVLLRCPCPKADGRSILVKGKNNDQISQVGMG